MTPDRDLERSVRAWLADGPNRLPDHYLNAALDEISMSQQRRRLLPAWRFLEMNTTQRRIVLVAAMAVALLALAATAGFFIGHPRPTGPTGHIAFVSGRDGGDTSHVYIMNADGTGQRLVSDASGFEAWPAISPDGTKLALNSARQNGTRETKDQIYVMNIDGSNAAPITSAPVGADCSSGVQCASWRPTWSPDGRRVAYQSYQGQTAQIYVVNLDGSGVARLTNDRDNDVDAAWSPNGTTILYVKQAGDSLGIGPIWVMNVDGTGQTRLTNDPSDGDPAWSPDGRMIAFLRTPVGSTRSQIFVMNADGSGVTALTNSATDEYGSPTWSPDGQFIAFAGGVPSADGDIYTVKRDGTGLRNVSNQSGNNWGPSWR